MPIAVLHRFQSGIVVRATTDVAFNLYARASLEQGRLGPGGHARTPWSGRYEITPGRDVAFPLSDVARNALETHAFGHAGAKTGHKESRP